jgi:arylformamidase
MLAVPACARRCYRKLAPKMIPTTEYYNREYNARAAIPEHPQIFARWADQAAATRRLRACLVDIPYGETALERLDLFPAQSDSAPLFVFIHGGYWRSLDKADFSWLAPPLTGRSIAVALLNYGLAPRTPLEEIVRQCLRAIAYLYRNGDRLGFDPERIFVGGHSAGAHLTTMMMAAHWSVYESDLPRNLIKGGLAVSGIYDLEPMVHTPFINVDLKLDRKRARRLSPADLTLNRDIPLFTAVGALESNEFRRQTALLGERWSRHLVRAVTEPGVNHLTVAEQFADPGSELFASLLAMVRGR